MFAGDIGGFHESSRVQTQELSIDRNDMRALLGAGKTTSTETNSLHLPITEELKAAVMAGKRAKAPGLDGISHDFYQMAWTIIKDDLLEVMNEMFLQGATLQI